jgi:hypothetical protein
MTGRSADDGWLLTCHKHHRAVGVSEVVEALSRKVSTIGGRSEVPDEVASR